MATIVQAMAGYSEDDWQFVQGRWEAIRAFHRQYILDHPGCIAIDETSTDPDPALQATRRAGGLERGRRARERRSSQATE
jgi:hypothetical protein